MAKARGESKTGLITTLVLFILATLGVGVYAYMQGDELNKAKSDATKATAEAKQKGDDRDWYRFQTLYYRALAGHLDPKDAEELSVAWTKFEGGQLGGGAKDKDEVTKLIKENLNKRMPFDPNAKRPAKSYEDLLHEAQTQNQTLQRQHATLDAGKKDTDRKLKKAEDDLAAATNNYQAQLDQVAKKNQEELSGFLKLNNDLRAQVNDINKQMNDDKAKFDEAAAKSKKDSDKKDRDLGKLRTRLDDKDKELALIKQKSGDAPKDWRTDWKVVAIDRSGTQPYINLGAADHVTPQLTFNVHGVGPDGRPLAQSKATVEVVNVVNDHLSQVRVTSWKDRERDPIVRGDVLFNPIWNPTLKKHVAVAGIIDLGDGRDRTVELIRNLEKQNIVVDAYLDLRDKNPTIKGPGISVQTDYLILGYGPSSDSREGDKAYQDAFKDRYEEMKRQAKENGVTSMNLRQYLDMIGYRLPRGLTERSGETTPTYRSVLQQPPPANGEKKEMKEPDKEPDKDKKEPDKDKGMDK
jgi:hypothetical protein